MPSTVSATCNHVKVPSLRTRDVHGASSTCTCVTAVVLTISTFRFIPSPKRSNGRDHTHNGHDHSNEQHPEFLHVFSLISTLKPPWELVYVFITASC